MKSNNPILLILTGGTICSFSDEDGVKSSDTRRAKNIIVENFRKSDSAYNRIDFDVEFPVDTLSENMSPLLWNCLISRLKEYDINGYKGVIILHGTDTLAYTACLLSMLLAGIKAPVLFVSSQLPLENPMANGNANFKAAVELIMNGIKPNVYVPYLNGDGKMYLHLASQLRQCGDLSNDFFSLKPTVLENLSNAEATGVDFQSDGLLIKKINSLNSKVIKIEPYVGLDYSLINIEGAAAIVHGTFHSQTLCTADSSRYSVFYLKDCFIKDGVCSPKIPLFITPCNYEGYGRGHCYETTAKAVERGAVPVWGMTKEAVYVKAMIAASMELKGEELSDFVLNCNINYENYF